MRERAGDPQGAEAALRTATRAAPGRADLRSALLFSLLKARRFEDAVSVRRQAARAGGGRGRVRAAGHALSSLGRHDEAAQAMPRR